MLRYKNMNIHWFGHDAFKVENDLVLYFDPFELKGSLNEASVIFVSHEHFDHCSLSDIHRIRGEATHIVAPWICQAEFRKLGTITNIHFLRPGEKLNILGIQVQAVPAYNLNKFRTQEVLFHPPQDDRIGFKVTVDGCTFYHAGDTDTIPEIGDLSGIDVAFLPVSGTYVMTAQEAASAVATFRPTIAIPMHWGSIVGNRKDAEIFAELAQSSTKVCILDRRDG